MYSFIVFCHDNRWYFCKAAFQWVYKTNPQVWYGQFASEAEAALKARDFFDELSQHHMAAVR